MVCVLPLKNVVLVKIGTQQEMGYYVEWNKGKSQLSVGRGGEGL